MKHGDLPLGKCKYVENNHRFPVGKWSTCMLCICVFHIYVMMLVYRRVIKKNEDWTYWTVFFVDLGTNMRFDERNFSYVGPNWID